MTVTTETLTVDGTEFPKLNTDLLRQVVTWAVFDHDRKVNQHEDPALASLFKGWGSWNQNRWVEGAVDEEGNICQTAFCIAGQTVAQTGHLMVFDSVWEETTSKCAPAVYVGIDEEGKPRFLPDTSRLRDIAGQARQDLGLTTSEGNALFEGYNEIGHVIDFALLFAAKRGQDLGLSDAIVARRVRHPNIESMLSLQEYPEVRVPRHECEHYGCPHEGRPITELTA